MRSRFAVKERNCTLCCVISRLLQKRERDELERQLKKGLEEEERFARMVKELQTGAIMGGEKHPFRKVLEQQQCLCPPNPFGMKPF